MPNESVASDTPNAVANVLTLFPWIAYIHRSIDFLLASTDKADNDNDLVGSTRWALSEKKRYFDRGWSNRACKEVSRQMITNPQGGLLVSCLIWIYWRK